MDTMAAARSTLVLVDYQAKLMPAIHGGAAAVAHALTLARAARELGIRVIGTEQNPQGLGPVLDDIRSRCDAVVQKRHFDACADGLGDVLGAGDAASQVVIAGCESHVCLLQTAASVLRLGRQVWVVEPACGSRRPSDHRLGMQRLAQAGAVLVSTEMVLFEWLGSCDHPRFRSLLGLIKAAPLDP